MIAGFPVLASGRTPSRMKRNDHRTPFAPRSVCSSAAGWIARSCWANFSGRVGPCSRFTSARACTGKRPNWRHLAVSAALAGPRWRGLVVLEMPLGDVYGEHWSLTGRGVPDAASPDTAVYLPGRNALLLIKPVLWCRLHGIEELALAVLASNPFDDATPEFFAQFESALARATGGRVRLERPFARLDKRQVMELGRHLPLELTFSCIAPADGRHCGRCNKCAERMAAFARSAPTTRPVCRATRGGQSDSRGPSLIIARREHWTSHLSQ